MPHETIRRIRLTKKVRQVPRSEPKTRLVTYERDVQSVVGNTTLFLLKNVEYKNGIPQTFDVQIGRARIGGRDNSQAPPFTSPLPLSRENLEIVVRSVTPSLSNPSLSTINNRVRDDDKEKCFK